MNTLLAIVGVIAGVFICSIAALDGIVLGQLRPPAAAIVFPALITIVVYQLTRRSSRPFALGFLIGGCVIVALAGACALPASL